MASIGGLARNFAAAGLGLGGLLLFSGAAGATPITVLNNSFESATGDACPTSWTCQPGASSTDLGVFAFGAGQYNPNGTDGLAVGKSVPDGSQALFINDSNGQVTQAVFQSVATIADSTTYLLSVWVGHRLDFAWEDPMLEFLANGTTVATSGLLADPGTGKWSDYTLSYTTLAADPNFGKSLSVDLFDGNTTVGQADFDLVTLTSSPAGAAPVPEPLTLSIFGAGLIGAAGLRRRRKSVKQN